MLYYLFEYLDKTMDVPGTGVFQYITFRSALAILLSLMISTIYGKKIITFLRNQQVGETVRELGLDGQTQKAGTPTMGGLIIIVSTLIPVILLTKLNNIYIILLIIVLILFLKFPFGLEYHNGFLSLVFVPLIILISLNRGKLNDILNGKLFIFLVSFG